MKLKCINEPFRKGQDEPEFAIFLIVLLFEPANGVNVDVNLH